MRRRRKSPSHPNHERWLVSYADFITLLFAFFVVMYSSAQVDQRRVGKIAMAIQVAFQQLGVFPPAGVQAPGNGNKPISLAAAKAIVNAKPAAASAQLLPSSTGSSALGENDVNLPELRRELETALSGEIARHEVALRAGPDGLVLSLQEIGFFASGSAQLKSASVPAFDRIAGILSQRQYRIRIEGHTDDVPIHNVQFADNWDLSTARATELVRLLIIKYGFAPGRLSAAGYAEFHPVASNQTDEGRAKNRRVDVVILGRPSPSPPRPSE
jgi:chemotaxis protein MotB